MNKARRHELKMLKYKKRLHNLNLKDGEGKFFSYRSHGAPCSCFMCSHSKYDRAKERANLFKRNQTNIDELIEGFNNLSKVL